MQTPNSVGGNLSCSKAVCFALSAHSKWGAQSRLYQYHCVRFRESAQCQRLVPPLWSQLNPIEVAFCTPFCLITNNCLSMKSAYFLHTLAPGAAQGHTVLPQHLPHVHSHKETQSSKCQCVLIKDRLVAKVASELQCCLYFLWRFKDNLLVALFLWEVPSGTKEVYLPACSTFQNYSKGLHLGELIVVWSNFWATPWIWVVLIIEV